MAIGMKKTQKEFLEDIKEEALQLFDGLLSKLPKDEFAT
jgi:hypothetical protein